MRVYVQFMGIRGTEKKNSLEAQDNLPRISANISRCTTRLNTPVFPIGAGSLEQGHGSTKSREKNNNWAVGREGGRQDGYQKKTELKRNLRG